MTSENDRGPEGGSPGPQQAHDLNGRIPGAPSAGKVAGGYVASARSVDPANGRIASFDGTPEAVEEWIEAEGVAGRIVESRDPVAFARATAPTASDSEPEAVRSVRDEARQHLARGIEPLPCGRRSKKPVAGFRWNEERIRTDADVERWFPEDGNLAVVLGQRSGGLIDIDLDWEEAAWAADILLRDMPAFGRPGRHRSHRIGKCPDNDGVKKLQLTKAEAELVGGVSKLMIVEVRGDGAYTVFPPSTHEETGEPIAWEFHSKLPERPWSEYVSLAGLIAFMAVVKKRWPRTEGSNRSELGLALVGTLLRAGVPADVARELVDALQRDAGHRGSTPVEGTAEKIREGEPATALPALCKALAIEPLEKKLRKWLGVERPPTAGDPIAEINRSYFSLLEGSRTVFFREEPSRPLAPMSYEAFLHELAPMKVLVPGPNNTTVSKDAARLWIASPERRYYPRGFVLDPSNEGHSDGYYNLWRGFGVEPREGDWHLMRAHVRDVLASGNREHELYILRWTAWKLQHPAAVPRVALGFRGGEGVGKGVFCTALVRIFGEHGQRLQDMKQVAGRFNSHLRNCCLLFADEAGLAEEHEGTLKGMLSELDLPIEGKGKDIVRARNHLGVVLASNQEWIVPAGIGARRFAIFDVPDHRKGDTAYFDALWAEAENGGLSAMLHDLRRLKLPPGWSPEPRRPATDALTSQKAASLKGLDRYWLDRLVNGTLLCGTALGDGAVKLPTESCLAEIRGESHRVDVSSRQLQVFFERMGFQKRPENERPRGWEVPPLAKARAAWDREMFACAWDEAVEWATATTTSWPI